MIVPDLLDEKVYAGVGLEVGVVTGVTSAITGASVSSSSFAQEKMMRLKRNTNKMCKILFIFSLH